MSNLLNQNKKTGDLAVLKHEKRFIYYLITKEKSRGKPTLHTLWLSLLKLKEHCEANNVTKLAIPQIGCGLDRLDWIKVKQMLAHIFEGTPVEIVVYIWEKSAVSYFFYYPSLCIFYLFVETVLFLLATLSMRDIYERNR